MKFKELKKRWKDVKKFSKKTKEKSKDALSIQTNPDESEEIFESLEDKIKIIGQGVFCDCKEIEERAEIWMIRAGIEPNEIGHIIELTTGKKEPIMLNHYDESNETFECKNLGDDSVVEMQLQNVNAQPLIWIIERGKRKTCYHISKEENLISVNYQGGILHGKNGTVLSLNYSDKFLIGKIIFNKNQKMLLTIFYPNRKSKEILGVNKHEEIENYLLGLDFSASAQEICRMLVEMLEFSDEDILNCLQIKVALIDNDKVRSIVDIQRGKVKEYGEQKGKETFHVSSNGDWHYVSPENCIDYYAENDTYCFATKGTRKDIFSKREGLLRRIEVITLNLMENLN